MSSMPADFSVLMAVWQGDHPDHFRDALRTVTHSQHLKPAHLVLSVDGPLPADLDAVAQDVERGEFGPATVLRHHVHSGLAATLQRGLEAAPTEIIARADADDLNHPRRFALQIPRFEADHLDILGSAMHELGTDRVRRRPLTHSEILRYLRDHSPFQHPTVVLRRSAVQAAGGYRTLAYMEDYDLWQRMLAAGARSANLPDPLVDYRVGPDLYDRRGGAVLFRSDLAIQRALVADGMTTRLRALRNLTIRAAYRVVPSRMRRFMYRLLVETIGI